MSILDAINLRLMPPDARRAMLEMRAHAAAGSIAPGRINKPIWGKQSPTTYMDDGYLKLALIFRCVGMTSTSLAKAILTVTQAKPDGTHINLPAHRMQPLLRQPNPMMRQNSFLATVGMMASVAGFVVIEKERNRDTRLNRRGEVIALWPLEPHHCFPILQDHAPPKWEYRVPRIREPFVLDAEDVIVFTYQDSPDLRPYGIGPVEACFREVGLSNVMTDFLKSFFDAGAQPQHGLILDKNVKVNQAKADDIKSKWGRRYGGLMKSIEPALLEGIIDIKRLSFDMNELAYQGLRDIADTAICQAFGVSPLLVDALAGIAKSTFSNKADARKGFYDETISGLWDRLDDVLTLGLLSEFEPPDSPVSLEFDTSRIKALQEDRNAKASWVVAGFTAGLLSNHTGLAELNIPVPSGQVDWFVRSIAHEAIPADDPLGLVMAEENKAIAASIAESKPAAIPATTGDDDDDDDEDRALLNGHRIELAAGTGPAERRAAIGVTNRKHIQAIARKSAPWVRTFFREQGVRVLSAASRSAGIDLETRSIAEIDWNDEAAELEKLLTRMYTLSGDTAWDAVNDQLGTSLSFDLANPNTQRVRDLLAKEVKAITDESRAVIQDVVSNGLTEGKSIAQIADDLKSKMDGWTQGRANTVARTESMLSYGHASAAGYRESGVVDRIQCFDNSSHTESYGAEDNLSCATRDGFIDTLESAELHLRSEHPNGSLAIAPVLTGEEV